MKLKIDFSTSLIKNGLGKGKPGVKLTLNDRSIEFRKRHDYENDFYGAQGNLVSKGEDNHGWQPRMNGLYYTSFFNLPYELCLDGYKKGMSRAEATGLNKDYSIGWILDEFDSSFNDLAKASLRYHMDWSVAECHPDTRKKYEDWIERVEKLENTHFFNEEELAHLMSHKEEAKKKGEDNEDYLYSRLFEEKNCKTCDDNSDKASDRKDERFKEMQKLRKEFIDLLPGLWS